jgi:hypothetical protein
MSFPSRSRSISSSKKVLENLFILYTFYFFLLTSLITCNILQISRCRVGRANGTQHQSSDKMFSLGRDKANCDSNKDNLDVIFG